MSAPTLVYEDDLVRLWHGDARDWLGQRTERADAVICDPPYGDTSLAWDRAVDDWLGLTAHVAPQMWCFGSMRFFMSAAALFAAADWRLAQEVVWEKHNGSSAAADRFRRVHELVAHFYQGKWGDLHRVVPTTNDATKRAVRRKKRPPQWGNIGAAAYTSEDGGPRLMRSVLQVRSEHGRAVHPTQKPLGILRPLIEYSVPPGGLVLDPFAGSASTLLAARELGRRAEGCEIDADYCAAAVKRLNVLTLEATA